MEKKSHIASHYFANTGCLSSKMIGRKTKEFSWHFVQFAENGTTRDVKIILWPYFVTKKKLLYGNAWNVNKSRNMPSRTSLWSYHSLMKNSTHCKQKKPVLLRATHVWKISLANFETKSCFCLQKVRRKMSAVESIFGKVIDNCCLQLFRNEFYCNRLSDFAHLF